MKSRVAVITNNKVQNEVATILEEKGISCLRVDSACKNDLKAAFAECEKIILPFPSTRANLSFIGKEDTVADYFSPSNLIIGGMIKEEMKEELKENETEFHDYFENEAYVLKNAYLTSQGALRLLLESTRQLLVGKRVLITGFGRIGKSLAFMLKSLGMKVFVAVRREEAAAEAQLCGFEVFPLSSLSGTLFYYDYIFNTIPSRIFSYKDVSHIKHGAIYFELASSPFGAEKKDFELLEKGFVHGGALPGRFYPSAVAKNIADYILSLRR